MYSHSAPRTRASTVRSGGGAPNHALPSFAVMATVIVLPTLSVANIRLSWIIAMSMPMSVSRLYRMYFARMAIEAVIDERPRAALQRRGVEPVDRRRLEPDIGAAGGRHGAGEADRGEQERNERRGELVHHPVTLSGTGFVLSRAVYHGISRKNRKYTTVSTRETTVARSAVPRIGQLSGNCPQTVTGTTPR